jgi:hypothetical protein
MMQLVRTIPRLGALPELHAFHCIRCNHAETVERGERDSARYGN